MTGIIFDFNGTLVFDTEYHEKTWRAILKKKLNLEVSDAEFLKHVHGQSNESIIKYYFGNDICEEEVFRLGEEKEARYRDMCRKDGLTLIEGAQDLFDRLNESHIPFAIATSSSQSNVQFYFEYLELGKWFDNSNFVYNDGTLPGKPAPDIYLRAAGRIGCRAEDCIVFEDSPAGIQSAAKAGVRKIIGVSSDKNPAAFFPPEQNISFISNYLDIDIEKLMRN